jgi:hypothetical protein
MKNDATSPTATLMTGPGTAGTSERLPDIAIEVERLCGAVRRAAPALAFEDEPSHFATILSKRAR